LTTEVDIKKRKIYLIFTKRAQKGIEPFKDRVGVGGLKESFATSCAKLLILYFLPEPALTGSSLQEKRKK